MIQLGVNIDHVATLRQARYPEDPDSVFHQLIPQLGEPDPIRAAHEAELGGADGITVHLREDRRHIQDRDVSLLRRMVKVKLNLEMAATNQMVDIATKVGPHTAMLVPEGRQEVTTEGGLDVVAGRDHLARVAQQLKGAGLIISAFIDPDPSQVEAAAELGFDVCEIHTGPYAHAFAEAGGDFRRDSLDEALDHVREAGEAVRDAGMRFNAGHALNYHNVQPVAALPGIEELHIGHSIVSRAVYTGLRDAVAEMKQLMAEAWQPLPEEDDFDDR
ncbi:MAG: pyridoxine 5'-phosphate synthase [Planctomycetota bacterium]